MLSPKEVCWRNVPPLSTTLLFVPHKKVPKFSLFCTCICIVQSHIWKMYVLHLPNQSILKISPGCSLEGLMLKQKPPYFGHLMQRVGSLEKNDAGRDWGQEKGTTEDEMAGWHHRRDGHEFG